MITDACDTVSAVYNYVIDLLEQCQAYLERLQQYVEANLTAQDIKKTTAILSVILETFADCQIYLDEKKKSVNRGKTWAKVITGQKPDEILKGAKDRFDQYFLREEQQEITEILVGNRKAARERVQKVIESLKKGPIDPISIRKAYIDKIQYTPPTWVVKDKQYCAWWDGDTASTRWLWVIGKRGTGKTAMVCFLLDYWKSQSKFRIHHRGDAKAENGAYRHTALAVHYGSYDKQVHDELQPDLVFQSLIKQLLPQLQAVDEKDAEKICEEVKRLQGSVHVSGADATELSWASILNHLIDHFEYTFMVIDGLDDQELGCNELIQLLASFSAPGLKLLVTSRNSQSMREVAMYQPAILMNFEVAAEYLEACIRARLKYRILSPNEGHGSREWLHNSALPTFLADPESFEHVVASIMSMVAGNFHAAEQAVNSLKQARNHEEISKKLEELRKGLGSVMQLDIDTIDQQIDRSRREVGLQALKLASHAVRDLTVTEMRYAVVLLRYPESRVNDSTLQKKVRELTTELLIDSSCGSLTVSEEGGIVQIDDALKYRCTHADIFDSAHKDIAEICLAYLDRRFFELKCTSRAELVHRKEQYPFYEYAACFWGRHVKHAGETPFLRDSSPISMRTLLSRTLFLNTVATALHETFQRIEFRLWNWDGHDTWKVLQNPKEPVLWAPHLLAYFGLADTISWWLQQHPEEVDRPSSTGTTPLHVACACQEVRTVEILLFDYHADATLRGAPPSGFNLAAAVAAQSLGVVERLLYLNPKELLQQTNWHQRQALGESVLWSNIDIVKRIVDASCAVDGERLITHGDRDGFTALHEAATVPYSSEAIRLLINTPWGHGLLQRRTGKWKDSALHLAAARGHMETVSTLLEAGSDPCARQTLGFTPLMLAVAGLFVSNERVIRTLVQWSKDHNLDDHDAQSNDGLTTWHVAARHGRPRNVELLIQITPKSLFNVKSQAGWTPIRQAAEILAQQTDGAQVHCINVLLRDQPNMISATDARDVFDALIIGRQDPKVTLEALERLLEQQKEPWPEFPDKSTILHKAVRSGNLEIVKVASRAEGCKSMLNSRDVSGLTPLLLAAKTSQLQTATFLLDEGADKDAQDDSGRTALHYAIERESQDLARQLLTRKIDKYVKDVHGIEALSRAAGNNKCLGIGLLRALKHIHPVKQEHQCLTSTTSKTKHVASGPTMRDVLRKEGKAEDTIALQHDRFLVSDPIPPQTKFPLSHIEVTWTWHIYEENPHDGVTVSLGLMRGEDVETQFTLFSSAEEVDRCKAKQTRKVILHAEDGIVNDLSRSVKEDHHEKAKNLTHQAEIGDRFIVSVDVHGFGRIGSFYEAAVNVYYQDCLIGGHTA